MSAWRDQRAERRRRGWTKILNIIQAYTTYDSTVLNDMSSAWKDCRLNLLCLHQEEVNNKFSMSLYVSAELCIKFKNSGMTALSEARPGKHTATMCTLKRGATQLRLSKHCPLAIIGSFTFSCSVCVIHVHWFFDFATFPLISPI